MTSKELKRARARQEGPKRYYAAKLQRAISYLPATPIDKKSLTDAVTILGILRRGTRRGWLYPEDLARLTELRGAKPAKKHATA